MTKSRGLEVDDTGSGGYLGLLVPEKQRERLESMHNLESQRVSIVLLGDFNPKIFHPAWFAAHGHLVPEQEAEAADVKVLNHDVCVFRTHWLDFQVLRERLQATPLEDGRDEELRDLILGTFHILRHTPIHTMGINMTATWFFPDQATWHELGHRLVPKEGVWDSLLDKPGMGRLQVQGQRPDGREGCTNVIVSPLRDAERFGVQVEVNDHFVVQARDDVGGAEAAMETLGGSWNGVRARASSVVDRLRELP